MEDIKEMNIPIWFVIRFFMLMLTVIVAPIFYQEMHAEFDASDFSWGFIAILFIFMFGSVLFILSLQYKNPFSGSKWTKPSWKVSLLDFRQPLQAIDMSGWVFTVLGLSVAVYTLYIRSGSLLFLFPLTIGIGVIFGVRISVFIFREKFTDER